MLSKLLSIGRHALAGTLPLLATVSLAQTTIQVGPGQTYTTIQSGINAAVNGDTVLVAPGTYNENINFNGKAITVTSSGGETVTTINGGNKPGLATVVFANGETSASVISGFTITGGGDSIFSGSSNGGIWVGGASPTIQGNNITANYCHNIDVEDGVATILYNGVSGVLESNVDSGPDESYCAFGSGINLGGTPNFLTGLGSTVIGNLIDNNTESGINLWAAQNVLIMNNSIRNNTSPSPGSAITSANSSGTVVVQNLIYDNTSGCGGALQFEDSGSSASNPVVLVANNTIVNNVMTQTLEGISNCAFISQIYPSAYSYGLSGPGVVFINNIISGSTSYPAVNCSWYEPPSESIQPTFENNILYNAGGPFFGSYCVDVLDKYNNIASDPQLVNSSGDYHLESTSPAIDSGQNSVLETFTTMTGLEWTKDAGGHPRVQDATGKGCIIDIGAYEYTGTVSDCGVSETLASSLNPAMAGQSVTFTAQLSTASGTPTGTIEFLDGANLLSTQPVSGTGSASFVTNALTVGSHTIRANYQPTGTFGASTASLIEVVTGDTTSTALTCLPNPIDISGTAQLTATVTSADGTPTGSISYTDNGALLATNPLLSGTTSFTYTGTVAGTHSIVATYIPTGSFAASSATCSEAVNALPTTSTMTAAPATATYGAPVTLTATVSPATPPGPSTPTGVVTFYNGASIIGTGTLVGGVATVAPVYLPAGSYNLTCTYGGSSIYATSNCNSVPVIINAAPTALALSSSNNPATYLSPVTLTVRLTVSGQSAGAGNTILLSINGQATSLTTDATGSASYAIGTLQPGSYAVTARFAGTSNLLASSAALTEVITAASTSTNLTGAPNPGDVNQPVTLTATVSSGSTAVGSGNVTYYNGTASLGTSAVSAGGTASITTSFSAVGVYSLTAVYDGNADFSTSTSAELSETIVAGDFSISATPGTASVYMGEPATVEVGVTSLQGFNQPLALTCSGLPADATCSFNPATLANGQGAAKLVIQTAAPHETEAASVSASAAVLGALTLLLLPGWRRRRGFLAGLSAVLLAIGVAMGMAGCGSANPITGGTPPGTYQVSVTATTTGTDTALAHSAVVTVTVKSLF
ncbi:MAG: Ig-like domain repeat protein [Terracidiphilus sp.]|jgi:hypothetical protein